MAFALPKTLVAGTVENVNDVQSNFGALKDELNGNTNTATPAFPPGDNTVTSAKIVDATIAPGDLATATLNTFLKLASVADVKMSFGTGSVTFSGGTSSAPADITHGLGKTPTVAICTANNALVFITTAANNSTTFTATGSAISALTGAKAFSWLAIG